MTAQQLRGKLINKVFHTKLPFERMNNVFKIHIGRFEDEIRKDERDKMNAKDSIKIDNVTFSRLEG